MPILKHNRTVNYCVIPNQLAQDNTLSYEARGVLLELLSRPTNWNINKSQLITDHCGKTKLTRIFKELKDKKYLKQEQIRKNGKIVTNVWIASDTPFVTKSDEIIEEMDDLPARGNLPAPAVFDPLQSKEYIYNKKKIIKNKKRKEFVKELIADSFKKFWSVYPTKKGKKKCEDIFYKRKYSLEEVDQMIASIENQIKAKELSDKLNKWHPEFPYPSTWLNQERWKDDHEDVVALQKMVEKKEYKEKWAGQEWMDHIT